MSDGSPDNRPLCSVILSVYNEELNLPLLHERLAAVAGNEPMRWEFIYVDDGSRDRSFEILEELHARDGRVKILRFARNFGAHETVVAGLHAASGDCAVLMSSDLQDPPELIPALLLRWREGFQVVWAARAGRKDPLFRRMMARLYYSLIRKLAIPDYPEQGTGSFCVIGRPVINALNLLEERNRVTFEVILWCGFKSAEVPYERPPRFKGEQKWTFGGNIKAAIDTILALSHAPIRWITMFGFAIAAASLLSGLFVFGHILVFGYDSVGWPALLLGLFFLGGAQFMCLGYLGEYLWRILQECRRRPIYLLENRVGRFGPGTPAPVETTHEHNPLS